MAPLPRPGPDQDALFLDFDGTLVDIASTPESVYVPDGLTDLLAALSRQLGGALALVSGRSIEQLDRFLDPLQLPAAGVHGAERRRADGSRVPPAEPMLDLVLAEAQALAAAHAGIRIERKHAAVAVHYRQAPACEALCLAAMHRAVERTPGVHLMAGKMVVEVLPDGVGKGHAVTAFLREPPFEGRRAIFVGDDVTDEAAFAAVQGAGGIGIKVGTGDTLAAHRLPSPDAVREWLRAAGTMPA